MSNEIEYIEPTQEHVGQMVEVRDGNSSHWVAAKLIGLIIDDYKFAAKCEKDVYGFCWRHARIPRPLTYAERQAKCGLKVGDRVKFVRMWNPGELGVHLTFTYGMNSDVGKIGIVKELSRSIFVSFDDAQLYLPYFVLEKVEDRRATHRDIGKTVYVDGVPDDAFEVEHIYATDTWRAVVVRNDKRFVCELSNLRVKE